MQSLLSVCLLMSFFLWVWLIMYPTELYEAFLFKYRQHSVVGVLVCLTCWLCLIGFIGALVLIVRRNII